MRCQVVFLKKDSEELVILDPDWLGADVIGRLLSYDTIRQLPLDGRIYTNDLRTDVAHLLATMDICAPLQPGLDNEIILPCLDRSEEPSLAVGRHVVNGFQNTSDKVSRYVIIRLQGTYYVGSRQWKHTHMV